MEREADEQKKPKKKHILVYFTYIKYVYVRMYVCVYVHEARVYTRLTAVSPPFSPDGGGGDKGERDNGANKRGITHAALLAG